MITKLQTLRTNNLNNIKRLNRGRIYLMKNMQNAQLYQNRIVKQIQECSNYLQKQI